jgi:hypothetical protein
MIHALAFALTLAADSTGLGSIRVQDYVPQPFESGSYPTLAVQNTPHAPVAPGYTRVRYEWSVVHVDSMWSTGYGNHIRVFRTRLYTLPGGSVMVDEPTNPPIVVILCMGVKRGKSERRLRYWSAYRAREDWTCYIGSMPTPAGKPDTMTLFPSRGETVCVRRTHP